MEIIITADYQEMSTTCARMIAAEIKRKYDLVLGLATGGTPIGTYKELIRMHKQEGLDFSKVTTFNLDEYLGLTPLHKDSYSFFMWDNLFNHVNINPAKVHVPQGNTDDPEKFCEWYEEQIKRAGGIDLQLLGIGGDGHIAFNDPPADFDIEDPYIIVNLDDQCKLQQVNEGWFSTIADVPSQAVSMSVKQILKCKTIISCVPHKVKADAVSKTFRHTVTNMVPATILKQHPDYHLFLDRNSASGVITY